LSARAAAGFNVFIELSVIRVVPHIMAERLTATEPGSFIAALRNSHCLLNYYESLAQQSRTRVPGGVGFQLLFNPSGRLRALFEKGLNDSGTFIIKESEIVAGPSNSSSIPH
jgi:hypothetical protein